MDEIKDSYLRRDFLKTTGVIGGALVTGFPAILSGAPAAKALKVGLIGCGGRGTGAAAEALKADDYAELTAMADVFPEKIEASLSELRQASADKVKVEPSRQFMGLDAYEKVIASDVDVVILATPPGFRPIHLKAAVEAGKHIFCEKPASIDAPGVRSVLESVKVAAQKNLSLVAGFCWRYSNYIQATFEQVRNGRSATSSLTTRRITLTRLSPCLPQVSVRPA
jgi:predicted dehydrogenase